MPIVGDHPESGARFVLERPLQGGPPWIYGGAVFTPDARFTLEVRVSREGEVTVWSRDGDAAPPELAEKARLLLRSLVKQARELPGGEPPRRIVRWRGEK
jgi:hypothetical protein